MTKNPNDRSDSKLGPTGFSNNLRKPSDATQYQKSTHRANSSVQSREVVAHQYMTPDAAAIKQSTISIRLKDGGQTSGLNLPDQSMSSFGFGEGQPHMSLSVKQTKRDF